MKKYNGILFDMDGTFIDSRNFHAEAYFRFFNKYFKPVGMDAVRAAIGPSTKSLFDNLKVPGERMDELYGRLAEFYLHEADDLIRGIRVVEGAAEVFSFLKKKGCKIAIITNSLQPLTERILCVHGLDGYFSVVSGASRHSLDKKTRCIGAMESLKVSPGEVLFAGDMERDIEIANALGYDSCFVSTEISWCEDYGRMEALRPTYTIHALEELPGIIE